jgi:hypothetical protein
MVHEGAGKGNALLLAAGQLPCPPALEPGQPHELHRLADPARLLLPAHLLLAQPVANVLGDVHVGEQGVVLEHRVHVPAVGGHARDGFSGEEDLPFGGLFEPRDHSQGGGLATAGRPEEGVERAPRDAQIHVVHGHHVPEALRDAHDLDVGRLG